MLEVKVPILQLIEAEINSEIDKSSNLDYINGLIKALGIVAKYAGEEK